MGLAVNRSEASKTQRREYAAEYKRTYPERQRSAQYLRNFGISLEQYEEMLRRQDSVCAICSGVNANGRRLSVDHHHTTGVVRALLCFACNVAIGHMRDDPDLLRLAAAYLTDWRAES